MLTTDNWQLTTTPKITDFGLAKRLDAQSTAWTQDGAVMGTPGYMAPEQAAGRVQEIGPATDVYALGCILYALLSGRPPFDGTSAAVLWATVNAEATPPSQSRPTVPSALDAVCLRCLQKKPADRYASAGDLARLYTQFNQLSMIQAEIQRGQSTLQLSYQIQP